MLEFNILLEKAKFYPRILGPTVLSNTVIEPGFKNVHCVVPVFITMHRVDLLLCSLGPIIQNKSLWIHARTRMDPSLGAQVSHL